MRPKKDYFDLLKPLPENGLQRSPLQIGEHKARLFGARASVRTVRRLAVVVHH